MRGHKLPQRCCGTKTKNIRLGVAYVTAERTSKGRGKQKKNGGLGGQAAANWYARLTLVNYGHTRAKRNWSKLAAEAEGGGVGKVQRKNTGGGYSAQYTVQSVSCTVAPEQVLCLQRDLRFCLQPWGNNRLWLQVVCPYKRHKSNFDRIR